MKEITLKSLKKDILKLAQPLFYSTVDDDYFEKLSKHKDCFLRSLIAIHPESSEFILNKLSSFKTTLIKSCILVSLVAYWGVILVGTFITFN